MAKLWLDDVRKPPDESWTWCKSAEDALKFVSENKCSEWALDHDLGGQLAHYGKGPYDHAAKTGFDFLVMFLQYLNSLPKDREISFPHVVSIHSTNRNGVMVMVGGLHDLATTFSMAIEIIVRPMLGRIMDKTPYHDPALRA